MNSFLKWPGGKKWFVNKYKNVLPKSYGRYFEPFLGGGSVFFHLTPQTATLSDINDDLINLYQVIRDSNNELLIQLKFHNMNHCEGYYYKIRNYKPICSIDRAARMLYLNRTCFNGMYRVNKKGEFNVPIGSKTNCIYDVDRFSDYSKALRNVDLKKCDFSSTIAQAVEYDLVFADPPYTVSHNQNSFIKYNQTLFSWEDQLRLLEDLTHAKERGVIVIATNAYFSKIIDMYEDNGFYLTKLSRHSNLASKVSKRRITEELLITSFRPDFLSDNEEERKC